ncbi:hypothetical protein N9955_00950 [bacterium]|nr:hypothetical protein [bacterium]
MKHLLVIARYKCEKQKIFEEQISPKNKEYCEKHGINYIVIDNSYDIKLFRDNPTWWKFSLPQEMIKSNYLRDGDILIHMDADMVIVDPSKEYTTNKSFSYAIDNGNTHCMGNYCMVINDWTKNLIDKILDDKFYEDNKEKDHWRQFREQAAWYSLAGIKPHSWESFFTLANLGFHSSGDSEAFYSLKELEEHVEIKSPEWNTTLLDEECDDPVSQMLQQYNIVKTKKEDTIIRHFAGGQRWREEYLK